MPMNRREALVRLGGLMTGAWLTGRASADTTATLHSASATSAPLNTGNAGQSFSFAHITDVHLLDRYDAEKWFAKCLHDIQNHPTRPAAILNTGDSVMDVLKVERDRADQLWALWEKVMKNELSLPMHSSFGNHDAWGYALGKDHPATKDPMYGKELALKPLGLKNRYNSFDHGDWHFINLDTIQPAVGEHKIGWKPIIDEEQFQWLKQDLEANRNRPVAVYSHMPILQICSFEYLKPNDDGVYAFGSHSMMQDAHRLVNLFKRHGNVKLCISGHIHLRDRVETMGTTYINAGAVSGGWWRGDRGGIGPGYSIVTFHPDGKFDYSYNGYGWEANDEVKAELEKRNRS